MPSRRRLVQSAAVAAGAALAATAGYVYRAKSNPDVIADKIVVVLGEDPAESRFLQGIILAVEQANAAGGVLGAPLRIEVHPDTEFPRFQLPAEPIDDVMQKAASVIQDKSVLAVIGHGSSDSAIPAAIVYDRNKIVFISTYATNPTLTSLGLKHIVSMQPSDTDVAHALSHFALSRKFNNIVVLDDDTRYAISLVSRFQGVYEMNGGKILLQNTTLGDPGSYDDVIAQLLDNPVFNATKIDALFLAGQSSSHYLAFIKRSRDLGLRMPILGPSDLIEKEVVEALTPAERAGLYAFSLYNPGDTTIQNSRPIQTYKAKFSNSPNDYSAIGYDAVNLLKHAIKLCGSRDGTSIANELRVMRFTQPYSGATGDIEFDLSGLITNTYTYVVGYDNDRLLPMAAYRKPFSWLSSAPRDNDDLLQALSRRNTQ
jgi:branched-chain amino acid transport system substrate-binding protein